MRSWLPMAAGIFSSCVCIGQSIWIGAIGGGMATNAYPSHLDIGLPLGLSSEADALYRPEGFQASDLSLNESGNS